MKKRGQHISCFTCTSRLKSVFCDISSEDVLHVNQYKGRFTYNKGDIIFHRGALPLGMFVIEKGKVKLHLPSGKGREQIVRLAGDGDIIGHRALLSDLAHTTTAEALEETHVCFLTKDLFQRLYGNNRTVHLQVVRLLLENLKTAESKISSYSFKTVKSRIAETLLQLKEQFGLEKENQCLNISLSRQDLSSLTGMATETLIRQLIQLEEEGMISLQGKKIMLNDTRKLQQVAGLH